MYQKSLKICQFWYAFLLQKKIRFGLKSKANSSSRLNTVATAGTNKFCKSYPIWKQFVKLTVSNETEIVGRNFEFSKQEKSGLIDYLKDTEPLCFNVLLWNMFGGY